MQKTSINPQIVQELLDSAANAADKGQSQFFTPLDFGRRVAESLPKYRGTIVDLNCGAAHLLSAASNKSTGAMLGADIDPCRSMDGVNISRITHDLTLLYPMLSEVKFNADLFVLNPPWGMEWYRDRLTDLSASKLSAVRQAFKSNAKTIDSTIATLLIALDLCSEAGRGLAHRQRRHAAAPHLRRRRAPRRHRPAHLGARGDPRQSHDRHQPLQLAEGRGI